MFETQGNNVKEGYKTYLEGILKKIERAEPDLDAQRNLHRYLTVLDNRRNTKYKDLFPLIYEELKKFDV